jgi:hypothetical protein
MQAPKRRLEISGAFKARLAMDSDVWPLDHTRSAGVERLEVRHGEVCG